jgi:hypothetical protein
MNEYPVGRWTKRRGAAYLLKGVLTSCLRAQHGNGHALRPKSNAAQIPRASLSAILPGIVRSRNA